MPIRRTPSSASPGPSSHSTPPPSRLRETDNMSLSDFTVQGSSSGGYGEAKVISVLVGRIVNKVNPLISNKTRSDLLAALQFRESTGDARE